MGFGSHLGKLDGKVNSELCGRPSLLGTRSLWGVYRWHLLSEGPRALGGPVWLWRMLCTGCQSIRSRATHPVETCLRRVDHTWSDNRSFCSLGRPRSTLTMSTSRHAHPTAWKTAEMPSGWSEGPENRSRAVGFRCRGIRPGCQGTGPGPGW